MTLMAAQLGLALLAPRTRHARRTDPIGSHEAARDAEARHDNDCASVLEALRLHSGCTSRELAKRSGLDRHLVARRLPDLERLGMAKAKVFTPSAKHPERVVDPTMPVCSESPKRTHSVRWWPVKGFPQSNPTEVP